MPDDRKYPGTCGPSSSNRLRNRTRKNFEKKKKKIVCNKNIKIEGVFDDGEFNECDHCTPKIIPGFQNLRDSLYPHVPVTHFSTFHLTPNAQKLS
uniref:Uncharacterized protein n=1 Tax=Romanomermis culicivorax TaxID=13658 RepID=A0A915KH47_ROMCU